MFHWEAESDGGKPYQSLSIEKNCRQNRLKRPKHFTEYFLCMLCWFSRSFKSFSLLFTIITFYLLLWNSLLFLKMLTEIPFSVISRCSLVPTSHWLQGKCARFNLSQAASGITGASCRHFQCQNRRFRVFEAGLAFLETGWWKILRFVPIQPVCWRSRRIRGIFVRRGSELRTLYKCSRSKLKN